MNSAKFDFNYIEIIIELWMLFIGFRMNLVRWEQSLKIVDAGTNNDP